MLRPVSNPPNPWHSHEVEWLGEPSLGERLEVYEEDARSILSENDSPDVGFRYSVNPYRGCFHGCAYCYARPYHQYLDWGAGTDFERKIVVKTNAAALLRREFARRSWQGETVVFSGITDCYQPLEASYRLTRGCLEVCREFRNPVSIITKGVLVRRDVELLAELASLGAVGCVFFSIPFASNDTSRKLEPSVALPDDRFAAMAALSAAGIPTGISLSPVIPALSDQDIPQLLERAAAAGARRAFMILLRLPAEVRPVFLERLHAAFPGRAAHVESALSGMRGGKLNLSEFGARMGGHGPRWEVTRQLFETFCKKLGINCGAERYDAATPFTRPGAQLPLF